MHTPLPLRIAAALILAALPLALGACEDRNKDENDELIRLDVAPHVNAVRQAERDWAWVSGTRWIATAIEGAAPLEGSTLWLHFEDGNTWVYGSAGCNRITGGYTRIGIDGLQFKNLAVTRMMCPDPKGIMQQEARFLHLLGQTDAYHAEPDLLTMSVDGVTVLRFTHESAATPETPDDPESSETP